MNNYSKIIKPPINQLINDNTTLVKKISWHLHGRVNSIVDIEDIIQIGMLGLISAAQNYVPQKSASFTSYASIRIKGEILDYLRKSFVKVATGVTGSSTASFAATTASAPSGMTATTENDFIFFMNGGYMEHNAVEVEQSGSIFLLKIDTSNIGYNLESDDEIIAQGKFDS